MNSYWASIVLGIAVSLIWVAPDLLWPEYRQFWLFENCLTGYARSSCPRVCERIASFCSFGCSGVYWLVPVLEELFWRGWLMRWLIDGVSGGSRWDGYTTLAFWTVALLFASEHGPFWDVGLLQGDRLQLVDVRTGAWPTASWRTL